jgi:hypothetical protein
VVWNWAAEIRDSKAEQSPALWSRIHYRCLSTWQSCISRFGHYDVSGVQGSMVYLQGLATANLCDRDGMGYLGG